MRQRALITNVHKVKCMATRPAAEQLSLQSMNDRGRECRIWPGGAVEIVLLSQASSSCQLVAGMDPMIRYTAQR